MLIALGVSGGIGAYKAVEVVRGLQKRGHEVVAVMTESATRFVAPLTVEAITHRRVITEEIVAAVEAVLRPAGPLRGRRVLVTAGPTYEDLDPVRYVGNRSSGRMGFAIADEALRRGAQVTLVAGPTAVEPPPVQELVRVRSASEMHAAVIAW